MSKNSQPARSVSWLLLGSLLSFSGCAIFSCPVSDKIGFDDNQASSSASISERAGAAADATRVSNPRAKQIRFNGQEKLLGGGTCKALPTGELLKQGNALFDRQKARSAGVFVQLHARSARRLLLEQPENADPQKLQFVARNLGLKPSTSLWTELQAEFQAKPDLTGQWRTYLQSLATTATDAKSTQEVIGKLSDIAAQFQSPLLKLETMRLSGELQIASEQTAAAMESFVAGAELAAQVGSSSLASDFWLMACEASLRTDQVPQARQCWKAAIASQLVSVHARRPDQEMPDVDSVFWEQAVRLAHPSDQLPQELTLAMSPWYSRIGIQVDPSLKPEAALWAAIAEYQIATGQPHVATLSIKRAETQATARIRPYLQITLARAMAAQGQQAVATTILGREAESDNPNIRASALAVLGAMKIHSGAYEQGSQFLGQALSISEATNWPGRLAASADLANAMLIMGSLDEALEALHEVQVRMLAANKWQSLVHSLENEAAILELEGRGRDAAAIRRRIAAIETRCLG
ncbi:MAG: hypothetical protein AAF394_10505 [Planctomycetota bacterium]